MVIWFIYGHKLSDTPWPYIVKIWFGWAVQYNHIRRCLTLIWPHCLYGSASNISQFWQMMKKSLFNAKSEFLVENFILFRTKAWNQALWGNSKNFLGHSITQDAWIPESSSKMEYSNSPSWHNSNSCRFIFWGYDFNLSNLGSRLNVSTCKITAVSLRMD